jgi:hypothetical protein
LANRKKNRRSSKRRPSTAAATGANTFLAPPVDSPTETTPRKRKTRDSARGGEDSIARAGRTGGKRAGGANAPDLGEDGRPRPPWHPLPLAEILILVGGIAVVIGLRKLDHGGISSGGPTLLAGIAAALIGTVEVAQREHLSGFRSHTVLLTLIPVLFFHSAVVLGVSAFARISPLLNIGLVAIDIAIIVFLFKLLRARYSDAHRTRVFEGRRSRR